VAPDDGAARAAAVDARLRDPGLAAREASAVAEFVRQELTWDRAALAMESVYRESLSSRKGAA
jgi:glycosyltransferase involved in cell wall biosynthesis